jgi:hypothetical protein
MPIAIKWPGMLADVVDATNVRMIEHGRGARLTLKSVRQSSRTIFLHPRQFEGDLSIKLGIVRQKHAPHAPGAEHFCNLISAESLANLDRLARAADSETRVFGESPKDEPTRPSNDDAVAPCVSRSDVWEGG